MITPKTHKIILKGQDESENISECKLVGDMLQVKFKNGGFFKYANSNFEIRERPKTQLRSIECISYFNEIARSIGLKETSENGEEFNILAHYLSKITHVAKDSALESFIMGDLRNNLIESRGKFEIIYPFGFNQSQKKAIDNSLKYKLSIIEGPPGTGKTQTILNIIANIVMRGENVAVVSSNNSAILNVSEKLKKGEVDFISAVLGNKTNRQSFIDNQKSMPEISHWHILKADFKKQLTKLNILQKYLSEKLFTKEELSRLKLELSSFEIEGKYFVSFFENQNIKIEEWVNTEISRSDEALELWFLCDEQFNTKDNFLKRVFSWIKSVIFFWRKPVKLVKKKLKSLDSQTLIQLFKYRFYELKIEELKSQIGLLEGQLEGFEFENQMKTYTDISLSVFKNYLFDKYSKKKRKVFEFDDLQSKSSEFTNEYPVVLSTTYSLKASLDNDYKYDYLIIDEASQVDLCTAFMALSCSRNVIVVGDLKQLPHVVDRTTGINTDKIFHKYELPEFLRYKNHSLLSSLVEVFPAAPRVLLREHYRCHPKIIEFCNKKFYGGQLIILTEEKSTDIPLLVYKTVEGNHARDRVNQRQIDVILNEIVPDQKLSLTDGSVGIITPYRAQTNALKNAFSEFNVKADTVDKFQGQESKVVILSTVDNEISEFTDNANRLNVAISRAIDKLIVIVNSGDLLRDRTMGDLVKYIEYNSLSVIQSKTNSVFDLLYKNYQTRKKKFLKKYKKVSRFDSENLFFGLLSEVLKELDFNSLEIIVGAPLSDIVSTSLDLTQEEMAFVNHRSAHVDFLIYDNISKESKIAIEVDGVKYHKEGTRQAERDSLKNEIFRKCDIPLIRFKTDGSGERQRLKELLVKEI